jgi:hypothetical protein
MIMEDNPWTEARVAELRCLVAGHVPYGQIARRLGVSRNAAIGKATRLKICPSAETAKSHEPVQAGARLRPVSSLICRPKCPEPQPSDPSFRPRRAFHCEPVLPAISSDPLNLSMEQLKFFHCRYITNDDLRQPTYCARDSAEGTSWCAFHLARVRAPLPADEVPLVPAMAPVKSRT